MYLRISGPAWGGYPPVDPENAIRGYWEQPYNWVSPAIHMAVLKGTDSNSEIVFWGAGPEARMWKFNPGDTLGPGAALFNVPSLNSNIFCGGNSVLPTGELLTTGGNEFSDQGLDHVNRFVPGSGWVTPRPRNMVENRYYPTNTALSDGTVLVAGGRQFQEMVIFGGETALQKTNEILVLGMRGTAPVVAAQPTGPFPPARTGHSVVFDDGSNVQSNVGYRYLQRPVIFGGANASGTLLSDVWGLYRDEITNWSWSELHPDPDPVWGMPPARWNHAAVFDRADSSMIVISGEGAGGVALDDVWKLFLYKGAQGKWERQFPSGTGPIRTGHTAVLDAANRRVLVFGGRNVALSPSDVQVLSLTGSPAWSLLTTTGTPPTPREGHAAVYDTKFGRKRLILFGGNDDALRFNDLYALDFAPPVPEWSLLNPNPDPGNGFPSPRTNLSMIHDTEWDRLVIIGGDENGSAAGGLVGDAWHVTLEVPSLKPDVVHPRHPVPPPVGAVASNWSRLYQNLFGDGLTEASAVFDTRWLNSAQPELFFPDQDFWLPLYSARKWQPLYPFHFLLPSGKVFYAGPSTQTSLLNVDQGAWETYSWSFIPILGGSAVQYLPGKIMKCGNQGVTGTSQTAVIDLTGPEASAQWTNLTAGSLMIPRVEHNLTILPTGKVLLTGGLRNRLDIGTAVRRPQIWDPETMAWGDSTLLALDPAKRDYHSSINLLPDGRLLSGGGELRYFQQDYDRFTGTIYWPPYLFDETGALATRPEIVSSPPEMIYDGYMIVETPQASTIGSVCLIRPGATTHAFNQEQRYVPLDFTYPGGDGLIVHVPENPNLLPTGNYFLFILNQDSVPSVAQWIKIVANVTGTNTGPPTPRPDLSAFPNPFSDATAMEFVLDRRTDVRLEIFDAAGRRIRVLDEGERDAGQYRLAWAGRDDFGRSVAGGVYFARLEAGGRLATAKLIVDRNRR